MWVWFYHSQETFIPLSLANRVEMLTWKRSISSSAETQFPISSYMPLFLFKTRSVLCLSPQSKSPVSSAKIPVQPPPQSSAGEQQQACIHPRRDRQSQRADGTGEQCVYISACELIYITQPGSISFLTLCLLLQDVSCNEIQVLPAQVGRLHALRELNIRKNCLHMLPEGQFATN